MIKNQNIQNMVKLKLFMLIMLVFPQKFRAQSINLSGNIYEYATYYVNSFDFSTGATNVQIFRYEISSDQYPVPIKINFRSSMLSPSLGIDDVQTIIEIETNIIELQAPLILDNRDLSSETTTIYDSDSPPNSIELTGSIVEILSPTQVDAIMQSVMTTGQIADGEYSFEVSILSENDQILASDSRTFMVQSPVSINLESPGGNLSDTLDNVIYSTYPSFQWFSQTCSGCNTFIRVAEFNSEVHSSAEEAILDQRVLPFDQTENWYPIDNINSFQYPVSDAYPLEEGNVYCWQVMMTLPTTAGTEEMPSSIFAFKIGTSGDVEIPGEITDPLLLALEQAIGEDQFNAYFGSGNVLEGFLSTGQVEVNGITIDASSLGYLLTQISNQEYTIQSISIE